MNDLSLSSSPQFFCDIMESISMQKEPSPPPNSPLVHIKSKWKKKRMASVGEVGGLMEGDDR